MARVLEAKGLSGLFEEDNITVFLPTSEAFLGFQYQAAKMFNLDYDNPSHLQRMLLYASVRGRYSLSDLPRNETATLPSRLDPGLPLYVNNLYTHIGQVMTINGARFLTTDIQSDNGVIHVVNRVIAPVAHRATLATYVESPPLLQFSFTSIYFARAVVPELTLETNRTDLLFTSFSPNDSHITVMPDYGQTPLFQNWTLLRLVYEAHVVKGKALFLPEGVILNDTASLYGTLRFSRKNDEVYVSNGRVRAKVLQANIPVLNGVLHVIDNLLYYIYQDVIQMVTSLDNTRTMAGILEKLPTSVVSSLERTDRQFTVFVPTDTAFSKMPDSVSRLFAADSTFLRNLVLGHMVADAVYDIEALLRRESVVTMNGNVLRLEQYLSELYLEWGHIRARIVERDLGVTNGVVHLIDSVMLLPNYTLWHAVSNLPYLGEMRDILEQFPELVTTLSSTTTNPMTLFVTSDDVMLRIQDHVTDLLVRSRDQVKNALSGHISIVRLATHLLSGPVQLRTLSGPTLNISRDAETGAIFVTGSHVTARVTVSDVWCSNGALYVIDELLHLPTRTVAEELRRRPGLKYMTTLFESLKDPSYNLTDTSRDYTLFVADNDAFTYLPWPSIDKLMQELDRTRMILRAHVVPNEKRELDAIRDNETLRAAQNVIHLLTKDGTRYVINNNLWAAVVTSDIPAVNGRLHIINRLLYIPYISINKTLQMSNELRPFHDLMSLFADYRAAVESEDRNITLFVPSSRYLRTVTSQQMAMMRADPNILKRLYYGHILPQVRMDDVFLRQFPDENYIVSKSSFNVSFTITRSEESVLVDGGYDPQILDVIGRAYGCTNGIIYVIDGFLNYSPLTILERLKREPSVSRSLEHMLQLPPPADAELLNLYNMTFTFLMPDDNAVDFVSYSDISYLHNMKIAERQKVFWRHVLNGSEVTYEQMRGGYLSSSLLPPDVTFVRSGTGLYFRYNTVNSRLTRWNLVACNGVIHLLTHFLYQPPTPAGSSDPPLNTPTSLNAGGSAVSSSGGGRAVRTPGAAVSSPSGGRVLLLVGLVLLFLRGGLPGLETLGGLPALAVVMVVALDVLGAVS